ncbi:Occludin/ELL domain-containing protein [Forsythia ovata]|uniref:Occludin/ELL domain-containing protein n=1 Tax=Forsythia ovata TaxID=205694 RepID=A0ABD1SQ23_9LAMI
MAYHDDITTKRNKASSELLRYGKAGRSTHLLHKKRPTWQMNSSRRKELWRTASFGSREWRQKLSELKGAGKTEESKTMGLMAGVGDKQSLLTESCHRKNEIVGQIKEPRFMGHSPKDSNTNFTNRSPLMNDRGRILRREHSDLELGEFHKPFPDETLGFKEAIREGKFFSKNQKINQQVRSTGI